MYILVWSLCIDHIYAHALGRFMNGIYNIVDDEMLAFNIQSINQSWLLKKKTCMIKYLNLDQSRLKGARTKRFDVGEAYLSSAFKKWKATNWKLQVLCQVGSSSSSYIHTDIDMCTYVRTWWWSSITNIMIMLRTTALDIDLYINLRSSRKLSVVNV